MRYGWSLLYDHKLLDLKVAVKCNLGPVPSEPTRLIKCIYIHSGAYKVRAWERRCFWNLSLHTVQTAWDGFGLHEFER